MALAEPRGLVGEVDALELDREVLAELVTHAHVPLAVFFDVDRVVLGGIGGVYNNMMPSLTLGTGSYGANSVSHNITAKDLLNIKTVAMRRKPIL